jgi:hypothetical protein
MCIEKFLVIDVTHPWTGEGSLRKLILGMEGSNIDELSGTGVLDEY